MKTEKRNGHQIRLYDFLNQIEIITEGKYLDITKTRANVNMDKLFLAPLYETEDGRRLFETTWNEIDGIDVKNHFPVFVDIKKAYGIDSIEEFNQMIHVEKKTEYKNEQKGIQGVYVIKAEDLNIYKIGCSTDILSRVTQIKTMSPVVVSLIGVIETKEQFELEKILHEKFKKQRKHGEWFELDKSELMAVKEKYGLELSVSDEIYSRLTEQKQTA